MSRLLPLWAAVLTGLAMTSPLVGQPLESGGDPAIRFKAGMELRKRLDRASPTLYIVRRHNAAKSPWTPYGAADATASGVEVVKLNQRTPNAYPRGTRGSALASGAALLGFFERHGHALLPDGTVAVVGQRPDGALLWRRGRSAASDRRLGDSALQLRFADGRGVTPEIMAPSGTETAVRIGLLAPGRYELLLPRATAANGGDNGGNEEFCFRYLEPWFPPPLETLPLDDDATICVPPPPIATTGVIQIDVVPAGAYTPVRELSSR